MTIRQTINKATEICHYLYDSLNSMSGNQFIRLKKWSTGLILIGFLMFNYSCQINTTATNINPSVLKWDDFSSYIDTFNKNDTDLHRQFISNSEASEFLKTNIPYFSCPDKELEKIYYFRWWTYRKHIKQTAEGFVITEFLPKVPWSGKYNTINCPAGHHFYEGRWLHNQQFLKDYAYFWFRGGGNARQYSFWAANSILAYTKVHNSREFIQDLLPDLDFNYKEWEKERKCEDGLFWQTDNLDGMEVSVGGSGKRATINSYIFGDAMAISQIAKLSQNDSLEISYRNRAEKIKTLIFEKLWDNEDDFFKTLAVNSNELVNVRELHGYVPWYFNLPDEKHANAWKQIKLEDGFKARFGPTSTEQRHSKFQISYEGHECQWNGPSWPFATTQTLKAMSNFIRNSDQTILNKSDFYELLKTYANSHYRKREDGKLVPWIDENINPYTGDWISRTRLKNWEGKGWSDYKGGVERGKDYNHSGFCDLIINDLVGIIPSLNDQLIINPLIPEDKWDWFCLDHLQYHNHIITIIWDRNGNKYKKGKGLMVYIDGKLANHSSEFKKITILLNKLK